MPGLNDLTHAQIERVDKLMRNGWSLDKIYGDGPISLSKVVHVRVDRVDLTEHVMVFVDLDGRVHDPRTSGTMAASAELYELGLLNKIDGEELGQ